MATFSDFSNPYQTPEAEDAASRPLQPGQRPGGLIAICIIALLIGCFGGLSSLFQLAAIAAQPKIQKMVEKTQQGIPEKELQPQRALQQKITDSQKRFVPLTVAILVVNIFIAGTLTVSSIQTLCFQPIGIALLSKTFGVAILFEIIRAIVYVIMQLNIRPQIAEAFQQAAADMKSRGADQHSIDKVSEFADIAIWIGLAFFLAFILTKIIFYFIGYRYLNRKNIRGLFSLQ